MLQCVWTQSRMLRPGVDAGLHVPFQTWSGSLASSQPLQLRCRVTVSGDSVVLAEWSPHAIVHSHAMLCALQVTAMGAPGAFTMHVWCVEMGIGARGRARPRVAQHVRRGRVMGAERGTGGPLSRVDAASVALHCAAYSEAGDTGGCTCGTRATASPVQSLRLQLYTPG